MIPRDIEWNTKGREKKGEEELLSNIILGT